jgi:hypothetical protein
MEWRSDPGARVRPVLVIDTKILGSRFLKLLAVDGTLAVRTFWGASSESSRENPVERIPRLSRFAPCRQSIPL